MRNRRRVRRSVDHGWDLFSFASFTHSSTLICPEAFAKFVKCIIAVRGLMALLKFVASFDLHQLYTRRPQLMIKRIAVGPLNDDFGLHPGQVRDCLNELFVVACEYYRQGRTALLAAAPEVTSASIFLGSFSIWRYVFPRPLRVRNADEMLARLRPLRFDLGPDQRTAERGHRALAVDDGGHAEFFIDVTRGTKARNIVGLWRFPTK